MVVMVGYRLNLAQQGGHVVRLGDGRLMVGNTLSQELVNHLHEKKKQS